MLLTYQLTPEDFYAAAAHHRRSPARLKLVQRARTPLSKILPVVFTLVAYYVLRTCLPVLESPDRAASPLATTCDLFLPILAVALFVLPAQAFASGLRAPNWRVLLRIALSIAMFLFAAAMLYLLSTLTNRRAATPPSPLSATAVIAPHLAWLALILATAGLVARAQRLNNRVLWLGQQHLHLPFTLDASVTGLTLTTANARQDYPWRAIPSFLETPTAFLLHVSDLAFHIVPKRAFPTRDDATAFRHMLTNLTAAPPPSFEVLPPAAAAS